MRKYKIIINLKIEAQIIIFALKKLLNNALTNLYAL